MKTQHTPGPWAVRDHWADEGAFEVYPTRGGEPKIGQWSALAEVPEYGPNDAPEAEANARLIAAAPDLLEALELMLENLDAMYVVSPASSAHKKARAAIAKATGEKV
jgi:hypothetical protein